MSASSESVTTVAAGHDVVQRATDFILSIGWRGITAEVAASSLQAIDSAAPGLLQSVLDQSEISAALRRTWIQLLRSPISAYDAYEFRERLPERIADWQLVLVAYPPAVWLSEAIGFPRPKIALSNVGTWVCRVVREAHIQPTPDEVRALVALAFLNAAHEGHSGADSIYVVIRGRESSLTATSRARVLAPHADALLRLVPELIRRGAGYDEDLILGLIATAASGEALIEGQL